MKRTILLAFFILVSLTQYCNAQHICMTGGAGAFPAPGNPGCAMRTQLQTGYPSSSVAEVGIVADLSSNGVLVPDVNGNLVELSQIPLSGSLSGDLGSIVADGNTVQSLGCGTGIDQLGLHITTTYSVGVHTVNAQFRRCDGVAPVSFNAQLMIQVLPGASQAPPCSISMLDPLTSIPKLWLGSQLVTRPAELANASGAVNGAAADGTAKVLLRIASPDGANISLSLMDSSGGSSTSPDEIGALAASSLVAHDDGYGAYAYTLYQAPVNFTRESVSGDNAAIQRNVQLRVSCVSGGATSNSQSNIAIVRPPVVLIHGLWSSASEAWQNFVPAKTNENQLWSSLRQNSILRVDYSVPPDDTITSTQPSYSSSVIAQITRNSLGFSYNAPFVLQQLTDYISNFRQTFGVAAVQADLVAHSMGGDIARTMIGLTNFQNSDNYGAGSIHKLITIGTPHQGTPLATQLLAPANSCVADKFARKGMIPLTTANFQSSPETSGAVADLQNGVSGAITPPIAYIAGSALGSNFAGLDCGPLSTGTLCTAWQLRTACGGNVYPADPLANSLTSRNWPALFGSAPNNANDAIVPQTSQLNGTNNLLLVFPYVVHSPGIETLGFSGPSELDSASGIPDWVVDLLNEPTTGNEFRH